MMPTDLPAHPPKVLENYYGEKTLAGLKVPVKHSRQRCQAASNRAHPYRRHGTCR